MDTKVLITFLKAVEQGSFSRVAEDLGYAPSTISAHIYQLEEELGYPLFDRVGKRVMLTDQGKEFIPSAQQICTVLDTAKSKYVEPRDVEGVLTIGMLESLMSAELVPLLPSQYFLQYPKVKVVVNDNTTKELFLQLRRNEVDIIFILGEKIDQPDLVRLYSRPESLIFVGNPLHPMVNAHHVPLDQVLEQRLILTDKISVYRKILEQVAGWRNLEVRPHLETDNTKFITSFLRSSQYISFLPDYVARPYIDSGELGIIHTDCTPNQCWAQAFRLKNKWKSPQMEGFIALLRGGKYPDYFREENTSRG